MTTIPRLGGADAASFPLQTRSAARLLAARERPATGAINGAAAADRLRAADGSSVQFAQVATQARFGSFVQAAGTIADTPPTTPTAAPPAPNPTGGIEELLARLPDDVRSEVERFVNGDIASDYYTPENTADRIVTFALGGFDRFEGGSAADENTSEAKRRFVDFILPAIDKGYAEALSVLGELPDEVTSNLERTRTLIGERLEAFAAQEPVDLDA